MSLESMLIVENRLELDGFARWYRAGEPLAAEEEPPPSEGLGPECPGVFGRGDGEPGCSGTVCGTPIMSDRSVAALIDCATDEKGWVAGGAAGCCSWRCRIGSSSRGVALAMPVPGFLMGNSSSSTEFDMGIGPDILPRMLWWPVLGRGPVGEAGPNIFGFMVVVFWVGCVEFEDPDRGWRTQ
jgi:hypothetical protein